MPEPTIITLTAYPDIHHAFEASPRGTGFLNSAIICDTCGRWQAPQPEDVQAAGWTVRDTGLSQCPWCTHYGAKASRAIQDSRRMLAYAESKANFYNSLVEHERAVLASLEKSL